MSDAPGRTPDVEALTAVLAERAREEAGPVPEPEELLDYLEGRLSPEAEAAMQRRLVASPAATQRLFDLADLVEAGAGEGGEAGAGAPVDLAVHAAWRSFERRLPGSAAVPGRANRGLAALAATLLAAVLALGTWVWRLEHAAGTAGGHLVANLRTLELTETTRSGEAPSLEVEPGRPFHAVLHPPERCPSYRAEVVTPTGSERVSGLAQDELGNLSLLLPGEPGSYALRLFGCEPERQISSYGFEILPPGHATSGGNATEP